MPVRLGGEPSTSPPSRAWASDSSVRFPIPSNAQCSHATTSFESRSSYWIRFVFASTLCLQGRLRFREGAFGSRWNVAKFKPIRGVGPSPSGAVNTSCSRPSNPFLLRPQIRLDERSKLLTRLAFVEVQTAMTKTNGIRTGLFTGTSATRWRHLAVRFAPPIFRSAQARFPLRRAHHESDHAPCDCDPMLDSSASSPGTRVGSPSEKRARDQDDSRRVTTGRAARAHVVRGEHSASRARRTASGLEHTASRLEHTAFRLEHTASRPEHTASRPEHTASRLEHTVSRLEHTASRLEHTAFRLEHSASRPEHSASRPEHTASRPEHTASRAEHTASRPEHTASRLEHSASRLEHSASRPEHSALRLEHGAEPS